MALVILVENLTQQGWPKMNALKRLGKFSREIDAIGPFPTFNTIEGIRNFNFDVLNNVVGVAFERHVCQNLTWGNDHPFRNL